MKLKVESSAGPESSQGIGGSNFSPPSRGRPLVDVFREARWINPERVRVYSRLLCASYFALIVLWLALRPGGVTATFYPVGGDFPPFWTASFVALGGHPAAVYDHPTLKAVEKAVLGAQYPGYQPFEYPPVFLTMVLPLALLPYNAALIVWSVVGLAGYLIVMCKIV